MPTHTSRTATALVALLILVAPTISARGEDQHIKVDIEGTLKTGIVAPGGETTGTTITVKQKDSLDVTWELDLGGDKKLEALAKELDGKTAIVTGSYFKKKGVEIRERHIVKVKTLKAAPAK